MNLFVLTGAGISAESGLGTFRDPGGLWRRFDPMRLATPEAFAAEPEEVHAFYNLRRQGVREAAPNAAHAALARLEAGLAARGGTLFLCTQNVDDLHERAGTRAVTHMHGEVMRARCTACGEGRPWPGDLSVGTACPSCGRSGGMRPDVVWFGEVPLHLDAIAEALDESDLFVAIGTSGAVYPAAGFVARARAAGIPTREINLAPSDTAGLFMEATYGPATQAVPDFVDGLLRGIDGAAP
ncbi:NAD-dependent deacylase [Methylobacterium sp. SyP6R]|uniref:NAD-dependent deacylase n=1 Tax=Methylobacterium sp. SyP6R TaxID=2718876 RepID=UPI001F31DC7D|nr:NAD-dependent deacylase [Methylobacterium sp. SyP6R]MCF4124894.1 NAD-dependent deacylase [Methylobacterium sp. SyP6R]